MFQERELVAPSLAALELRALFLKLVVWVPQELHLSLEAHDLELPISQLKPRLVLLQSLVPQVREPEGQVVFLNLAPPLLLFKEVPLVLQRPKLGALEERV